MAGAMTTDGKALYQTAVEQLGRGALGECREGLAAAAKAGNIAAARAYSGFLAAGVGGPRQWGDALDWLAAWADRDPVMARQLVLIGAMDLDAQGDPGSGFTA